MSRVRATTVALIASFLGACTGAPPNEPAAAQVVPGGAQAVTVTVSPDGAVLRPGAEQAFAAAVTGTAVTTVTWSLREGASGGSVTAGGLYTAPAVTGAYHVVATSDADPTVSGSATVTVAAPPAAVSVVVTPGTATVNACQNLNLSATVSGSSNASVTWSVAEAAGGTVSGGVYTAPSSAGIYHVVATSQADPTKSATATLTAVEKVLGVAVSPATLALAPGKTGQFTATVTTTCGSVSQLKTVTAPVN